MPAGKATVLVSLKTTRPLRIVLGTLQLANEVLDLVPDWEVMEKDKLERRMILLAKEANEEMRLEAQSR